MSTDGRSPAASSPRGRLLVVDDDPELLRGTTRALAASGHTIEPAEDGRAAADLFKRGGFDLVLSDIAMPGMDGIQLLRAVRELDLDVPVVLMTSSPTVETASNAIEFGAFRYLVKPVEPRVLNALVDQALRAHRMAKLKREALALLDVAGMRVGDRAGLEVRFESALKSLWMAYQPIVHAGPERGIYAYEALVRTDEPAIRDPGALFDAAEKLGRVHDLGRVIRGRVAENTLYAQDIGFVFVNLHPSELTDDALYSPDAPLSRMAKRVVLEITERSFLDEIKDVRARIASLRQMGFRIAVDDLGAGYAGLTSFARLEPEVVKLDMTIVRDVHKEPVKQKLIRSMTSLCAEMGIHVIAEGVEVEAERDTLIDLRCDLLQGYLFAKPGKPFPAVKW